MKEAIIKSLRLAGSLAQQKISFELNGELIGRWLNGYEKSML